MKRTVRERSLPQRASVAAFTLTEILIALAIFSIVIAAAMAMFNSVQRGMQTHEAQVERLREVQLGIRQIEEDIRHIILRVRRNEYRDKVAVLQGDGKGNNAFLEFSRAGWRNPAKLPRSQLQHVKYTWKDDAIVRSHWLYLDAALEEQQYERILLSGVEEFELEFLVEEDWRDEWFPEEDKLMDLPRAIKVSLTLVDYREIERIVVLPQFSSKESDDKSTENQGGSQ